LIFGGWQLFLIASVALIWPVAMIWFGEEIGDYLGGFHRIGRPYITKKSPGSLGFGLIFFFYCASSLKLYARTTKRFHPPYMFILSPLN